MQKEKSCQAKKGLLNNSARKIHQGGQKTTLTRMGKKKRREGQGKGGLTKKRQGHKGSNLKMLNSPTRGGRKERGRTAEKLKKKRTGHNHRRGKRGGERGKKKKKGSYWPN